MLIMSDMLVTFAASSSSIVSKAAATGGAVALLVASKVLCLLSGLSILVPYLSGSLR